MTYDPDEEENEMIFNQRMGAMKNIERKDEDELLLGDEGGMIYKYDLPVLNEPLKFNTGLQVIDEGKEIETSVEKLFEILDCDKETAYESFIIKFNQEFNHEVDMYGDIRKAGEVDLRVLDFGVPIPHQYLADEPNMKKIR